jgi:outer membrane immunogenic protein
MKRILTAGAFAFLAAGPALAADLPPPPAPPPRAPATYVPTPVPYYNWTGIYFGVNGGYGFGTSNWTATSGGPSTGGFNTSGFLGGGTVGFNYQWAAVVAGLEGDLDWTNLKGSPSAAGPCGLATVTGCQTSANWLGTARGRLGYAFDRILLFATGGAAFSNEKATGSTAALSTTTTTTGVGWTAGAGVEVALAPNWTAKAEYLYVSLPNGSFSIPTTPTATTGSVKFQENVIRAGVNFKFNL